MTSKVKLLMVTTLSSAAFVCGGLSVNAATNTTSTNGTTLSTTANASSSTSTATTVSTPASTHGNWPQAKYITYTIEGMKQSVKANLFVSSQGYHMYTLRGYKAAGEEPSKDVVLYTRNQNNFMRIEMLPTNVNLVSVRDNAIATLKASSTVTTINPKTYGDSFFRNAFYIANAHNKRTSQTVFIMKIKGDFYRILIHTPSQTESITPYWAMMKTIEGNTLSDSTPGSGIVAGVLEPTIHQQDSSADGSLNFTLTLKNQTEQVQQLTFNNGERFDYILYKNGTQLSRYALGKMFSNHVETIALKQGEELEYPIQLSGLEPGNYRLVAWVTYSAPANPKKTLLDFDVQ